MNAAYLLLLAAIPGGLEPAVVNPTDRMFAYGAVIVLVALVVWHGRTQPPPPPPQ